MRTNTALLLLLLLLPNIGNADIHINEIAWMGTHNSSSDEWIELYNSSSIDIDVNGWRLMAADGTPSITLSGIVSAGGYFLLERTDDSSVPGVSADIIYTGGLENGSEYLSLLDASGTVVDTVSGWSAGSNTLKASMERNPSGWNDAITAYVGGLGTPKAENSQQIAPTLPPPTSPSAINVYFNKHALLEYASNGNEANDNVNLEKQLITRIKQATQSIDVATYEINLPDIVDALIERASQGVNVRLIADAKKPTDASHTARYEVMRAYLEKLARGADGTIGTSDDIVLFSDSPIFAVQDTALRQHFSLPDTPVDLPYVTATIGNSALSGYLLAEGESKAAGNYYSASPQMHNKFVVVDNLWVWTGSWNFTTTGLYGSEENRAAGVLGGNTQHAVEIESHELAVIFTDEFNEMWGSDTTLPSPQNSNFHQRKFDNTAHVVDVDGTLVEVYFSPGDNAIGQVTSYVQNNADDSVFFTIFAWSDQALTDTLKLKWEGSSQDLQGTRTGFTIKGVFDGSFWNQWWSASIDMTGRTASRSSLNNPNIRWANPAPVYKDSEDRKLHSKTMIVDACSSDPTVIVGSTNWSINGNDINDENLLMIHDAAIANQFLQAFYARYEAAGGAVAKGCQ